MKTADRTLTADGPDGELWAYIAPEARQSRAAVAPDRFSSYFTPFPSVDEAEAALIAAGGTIRKGGGR